MAKTLAGEFFGELAKLNRRGEWSYPSSDGKREYTAIHHGDGKLSCNCMGWTRQIKSHFESFWHNGKSYTLAGTYRFCTHVAQSIPKTGGKAEIRGTDLYVP